MHITRKSYLHKQHISSMTPFLLCTFLRFYAFFTLKYFPKIIFYRGDLKLAGTEYKTVTLLSIKSFCEILEMFIK